MKTVALLESDFHSDGRGPELQRVIWGYGGRLLIGFEYFNPEDIYEDKSIKHLKLVGVEAYSMAGEEVHDNILTTIESKASIFRIENSSWLKQINPRHLEQCSHYQIVFYDEIYDVICKEIKAGKGCLPNDGV